jgi:hypothetical protein
MGKLGRRIAVIALGLPIVSPAQSSTETLQRALIAFKSHLHAGISYVAYSPAVADLNTEIELSQRTQALPPRAAHALTLLQADMTVMGQVWSLRFGPLAPDGPFTYCQSEIGQLFASTGATFKEQGLMDADLRMENLSGQCAYYTDTTMAALLAAVAMQADKSLDALTASRPAHRHR